MTKLLLLADTLLALLWWKRPRRETEIPATWRQDDYENWQRDWERWAR